MNKKYHLLTGTRGYISAAIVLAGTLMFFSVKVVADDTTKKEAHQVRTEQRILEMHDKLNLDANQEELWGNVTQILRDNAKTMDTLTQNRVDQADKMNAVEDLKSYGEIAQAHANGVQKMIPAFSNLFKSMTVDQQKSVNSFFHHGTHMDASKKMDHEKGKDK